MADKKKVVLSIDDDDRILRLIQALLINSEFEIHTSNNVKEGIQTAKHLHPDVILLDIMMPLMDGFQAGKVLKRNPDTKDIPIIFLTARKSKSDLQQAIMSGGVDYLVKPFQSADLISRLRKALGMEE
ncbi:PleD family two-component system response regulator [Candidatus Latescibacterota bacterium]